MSYHKFKEVFKQFVQSNPTTIQTTLSNIFSMRLIGNKTHGDLAEIAIVELINQFLEGYESIHVGKDLFRAKDCEEDIVIVDKSNSSKINVSLKAYGEGYLQLSTDKNQKMFPYLQSKGKSITNKEEIKDIFNSDAFKEFQKVNIMPLIYNEKNNVCNIMIFNFDKVVKETSKILYVGENESYNEIKKSKSRKHPIYSFLDKDGNYICEVRYGGASANALQRGFWTNTKKSINYFDSLTDGWINYNMNLDLVKLMKLVLNSTKQTHLKVIDILENNLKNN